MTSIGPLPRPRRLYAIALGIALLGTMIPLASVSAAGVTVTKATGGEAISADTAKTATTPGWTTLTGPTINELSAGSLSTGTIVLSPTGSYEFHTPGSVGITEGADCTMTFAGAPVVTSTTITITITAQSSVTACAITFVGIEVQPTTGVLPQVGKILETGTATGMSPGEDYGDLTMVVGAPVLAFTQVPTGPVNGGAAFSTQPIVTDQDQFNNSRDGDLIQLSATGGTGTLSCATNPVAVSTSHANFAGCSINTIGSYQIRASTAGATPVDTASFDVVVGPADHLVFTSYPAHGTTSALSPQPAVSVYDLGGNLVNSNPSIMLTVNQNAGSFTCAGGTAKSASGGVAQFTGCSITTIADNYHLTATGGSLTVVGADFNVSGTPSQLQICFGGSLPCNTTPPNPATSGSPFTVVIRVEDSAGNTITSENTAVTTLAIAPGTPTAGGPGALSCGGSTTKTVSDGIASFTCSINAVGTGYALKATSVPNYISTTSSAFNVVIGQPTKLVILHPPVGAGAGSTFTPDVQVAITDPGGNVIGSGIVATVQLSIGSNPVGGVLTCSGGTTATTVNGIATFHACSIDAQGGPYTLIATATTVTPNISLAVAQTDPFTIGPVASTLTIAATASVITWGGAVTLTVGFPAGGAGKSVDLQVSKDNSTWTTITTLTTDASGKASFAYRPSDNRYYRSLFAGSTDLAAGASPSTRVVVRQISVLRPTNNGKVKVVGVGTVVKFVTTVRPARPELAPATVTYDVYLFTGGKWQLVVTRDLTINAAGTTSLTLTFSATGSFYVRSIARPTPSNANSPWSPIERYDVR